MKISTMRALDARLGRWICRGLTLVRRVLPERRPSGAIERVLLIKFWGMGSLVCATPLATALRERHPGLRLDLLTFEFQRETATFLGIADRVWTIGDLLDATLALEPNRPIRFKRNSTAVSSPKTTKAPRWAPVDSNSFLLRL